MIIDSLLDTALENSFAADLRQALDYLRRTDLEALPPGRHEIDGDHLFALLQDYTTRSPDQCVWEAHRRHIDVQYVVHGVERIRSRAPGRANPERDVAFFDPGTDYVTVRAGMFAVFMPPDVHSPPVAAGAPSAVLNVVVKVRYAPAFGTMSI
jgi:YhcH/YjgK/YiaL family protein